MADTKTKKTAGALDVRNIIGALMGIYGVILVLMAVFSDSTAPKSADVNSNLWAGLGLLAVAAVFLIWVRLRPLVVKDVEAETDETPGEANTPPGTPQH